MTEILIRYNDIEMPKNGTLTLVVYPNGDVYLGDVLKDIKIGKVIELPSHGELVDRSRMKGAMYEIMRFPAEEACTMYEELIEEAPVVLEAST